MTGGPWGWGLGALFALAAIWAVPAAIVNKQLAARGHRTFATPADIAGALFDGSSKVDTAIQVIVAFVLLAAIAALVGGVARTLWGGRGGLELAGGAVFGILGLSAATTVVM